MITKLKKHLKLPLTNNRLVVFYCKERSSKLFKYYVAYVHEKGFGFCEITRDNEIDNIEDLMDVKNVIVENGKMKNIIILNYILLPNKKDKAVNKDE